MPRPRTPDRPIHLRSARMLDVDQRRAGRSPGDLLVDGDRISRGLADVGARRRRW